MKQAYAPTRHRLSAALLTALIVPFAGQVLAQDADQDETKKASTTAQASGTTDLDKVQVVGSRIKRAQIEGPAPVQVITRAEIEKEGFTSVGDVLMSLPQQASATFSGDQGVTGFTPNAQVVNLRGLGPGFTLTLVNGRRPAQYPQPYNRDNNVVNVRAIPTSIVERIEVLSGGASAIYGSDAVAGVVNIVLRENMDGNAANISVGTTHEGGGDRYDLELSGGRSGDRWSAMWAFQAGGNEAIFGDQRSFMADTRNNPYGLTVNPNLALIAIRQSASPSGPTGHEALYPGQAVCDLFGFSTVTTASRGTYCGSYETNAARTIRNSQQYYSAYGHGTFDITPNVQLFGSATFFDLNARAGAGTEFWSTSGDRFNTTASGGTTSVYFDADLGHLVQLQRVFQPFELGGPEAATTHFDEQTYDITAGLRGTWGERWDWEGFVQHAEYDYTQDRPRLLAKPVHDLFLGPRLGYVSGFAVHRLNRNAWFTPWTPEQYQAVSTRVINQGKTSSSAINFNFSGDLFDLPAGPVGFAGVIEGVRQTTDLRSDPRTDPLRPADGQTVYNLVSSGRTEGERDRYAIGAEFRVPILSNLSAQLAARYDLYDDITNVDGATTYNLGLEFRPFESLLLRSSYATSFKAPDMQLVFAEGAASYSNILDEYSCRAGTGPGALLGPRSRAQCNVTGDPTIYSAQTNLAGNPGLKEEEGTSWTAGFVWDIMDNMSVTVDWYRIELEDQAAQLSGDYIMQAEAACRLGSWSNPNRLPTTAAFCDNITSLVTRQSAPGTALDGRVDRINAAYINLAYRRVEGYDATYRYRHQFDRLGTVGLNIAYSLTTSDQRKTFPEDPIVERRDDAYDVIRSRVRASVSWSKNDYDATLFMNRLGSSLSYNEDPGCFAAPNQNVCWDWRLDPFTTYNLTVGKRFGQNVRAQIDVVNLENKMFRNDPSAPWPYYYAWTGADPWGRRFNFSVSYRF